MVDQAAATVPIEPTASAIAASALATAALALAPRWPTVRLWTAASGVAVTGAMVALRVDAGPDQAALVLVGVGAVAAVAAEVRRARLWGHVGLIGQLSALVAVGVAVSDLPEEVSRTPARLAVVVAGCWAAFAVSAVVEEARGSSVADLLARSWVLVQTGFDADAAIAPQPSGPERAVRLAPLVVAVALAPLALVAALDAGGIPAVGSPWIPVAPVGLLALGGVLARLLEPARRPAAAVLAVEGTVLASLGVLAVDPDGWPVVVALALLIGLVVVVGPRLRRGFMVWIAVVASDLLVGATADVLGVDDAHVYLVPLVWGGLLVVASLAWDRRSSEAERSARWRRPALLAPFSVGMATLVLGWLAGLGEGASAASWSSLIAAGFLAVASVQLGAAWLTTASWLLITVTAGHLSPRDPLEQPWVYVPWTAALLVAAEALHRWAPARAPRWRDRWSVPPLASAGVVALVALAVSLDVGWVPATWCGIGGLALLVAARVRWAPLGLVGTFVVLVGAGAAGPGWLALAFAATTVGSVLIAVRVVGPWRTVLQVMASSAVVGAWASLGTWASWTPQEWVIATAAAAVFGSLALGLVIRFAGLARDWTLVVVAPIALALAGLPLLLGDPSVDQAIAGLWAAAAFGAAALAAGGCARPSGLPWLREVSAVIALLAGALVLDAVGADVGTVVISCGIAVVLLTAALVLLGAVRPGSVWSRPIEIAAVGALVGTWVGLASDEIALVEVALLLTGAELVALGVTRRRPLLVELAPSAFCAAWIAYALDALGGDPGWFAAPVGLTVLATVSLARRQRRSEGLAPATDLLSALEIIGMVLLVIAPLVRTISVALAYAALAIALGLALGVWGIATRVRQRLAGGAVTVVAAVALLLLVPIVDSGNARRATGPWLWLAVALVGLIAIVAAALLERGRRAIHQTTARLQELTRDWE